MLFAILRLLIYANGDCMIDEIKKIFNIALSKYKINPALMATEDYSPKDIMTQILKSEILWEMGQRINQKFVDDIRESIFKYAMNLAFEEKVGFLSLKEQQILLMIQLPYYEKVKTLFESAYLFDRNFFEGDANYEYYEDIIDYLYTVGSQRFFSEFYNQEFPKLYELIIFLIKNALPLHCDENKTLKSVEKFNNPEVSKKVKNYLQNLSKMHQLTLDKIDETLLKNGIEKVRFRAKIKDLIKRTSKKGRWFYLISFEDDAGMLNILYIPDNKQLLEQIKQNYNNQTFVDVEVLLKNFSNDGLSVKIETLKEIHNKHNML
jgi:hypothetical protein